MGGNGRIAKGGGIEKEGRGRGEGRVWGKYGVSGE